MAKPRMKVKSWDNSMVEGMRKLTAPQVKFLRLANQNPNYPDASIWADLKSGAWQTTDPATYGDAIPPAA